MKALVRRLKERFKNVILGRESLKLNQQKCSEFQLTEVFDSLWYDWSIWNFLFAPNKSKNSSH